MKSSCSAVTYLVITWEVQPVSPLRSSEPSTDKESDSKGTAMPYPPCRVG